MAATSDLPTAVSNCRMDGENEDCPCSTDVQRVRQPVETDIALEKQPDEERGVSDR